jgi:2'-5' RNA ligase
MPFAINIKANGASAFPLYDLWRDFSAFEPSPSMASLGYPPHLTLAVYHSVSQSALRDAMRATFASCQPLHVRFSKLSFFEHPKLVIWAAPNYSELLGQVHTMLHQRIDPSACLEYYRPGTWVPHCTLATNVAAGHADRVKALAARPIEPFEVVFDAADCAEFYPVRVIEELRLTNRN